MAIDNAFKVVPLIAVLGFAACTPDTPVEQEPSLADTLAVTTGEILNPLESGKSRVVVYRNDVAWGLFGLAAKLSIKLDGQDVGICDKGKKLVLDIDPDQYQLSMQTDIIAKVALDLTSDSTTFISCGLLPIGILLPAPYLNLVEGEEVPEKIASLPVQ